MTDQALSPDRLSQCESKLAEIHAATHPGARLVRDRALLETVLAADGED